MKQTFKNLVILAAVAGLTLAVSGSLHAQALEKVTISSTVYAQGPTDGDVTKSPLKSSITGAYLLAQLAADESDDFTNAASDKLGFDGTNFVVLDGKGNEVFGPIDELSLQLGSPAITAGLTNTPSGTPPYNQVSTQPAVLTYTSTTGGLTITVNGLATITQKTTLPTSKGKFIQTGSLSFVDGTGGGSNSNAPIVVTGFTITATGTENENTSSD